MENTNKAQKPGCSNTVHCIPCCPNAMPGHWQHNRLLTSTLIKHLMLFITWLQNNYIKYSKALQNMVWWIAAGSQKLLRCTPNTNSTMYSEQSSHVVSNHHLIFRKVNLLSFILAEDTHLYHSSGWIGTVSGQHWFWANSCNKHTLNSTVQLHSRYFNIIVIYRPQEPFLQADISLKRYCPWKIWPFDIHVKHRSTTQVHNSLTETVYRYIQNINTFRNQNNLLFSFQILIWVWVQSER